MTWNYINVHIQKQLDEAVRRPSVHISHRLSTRPKRQWQPCYGVCECELPLQNGSGISKWMTDGVGTTAHRYSKQPCERMLRATEGGKESASSYVCARASEELPHALTPFAHTHGRCRYRAAIVGTERVLSRAVCVALSGCLFRSHECTPFDWDKLNRDGLLRIENQYGTVISFGCLWSSAIEAQFRRDRITVCWVYGNSVYLSCVCAVGSSRSGRNANVSRTILHGMEHICLLSRDHWG